MADLTEKTCVPCEGGVPRMTPEQARRLLPQIPGWDMNAAASRLTRTMTFADFVALMAFLNRVADLAEAEGHHPDFNVSYNKLSFEVFTHAIGGLSENDFILCAKINDLQD